MSENPSTTAFTILYAVSEIFEKILDKSQAEDTALSIIDDIRQKDLSKQQVITGTFQAGRHKAPGTEYAADFVDREITKGS